MHTDGDGHHKVVLLQDEGFGLWSMLFFTTRPYWAEWARLATAEERAFAHVRSPHTFLALTKRPISEVSLLGTSFPEHRVRALLQETTNTQRG